MFDRQDRFEQKAAEQRLRHDAYCLVEADAASITKRAADLKLILDPVQRRNAALSLLEQAQAQANALRQVARQKGYQVSQDDEPLGPGDYATHSGEALVSVARDYTCPPQSVWAALSDQFPDVHFTVDWFDLSSLIAAEIRYWRIAGIIQGLDFASPPTRA